MRVSRKPDQLTVFSVIILALLVTLPFGTKAEGITIHSANSSIINDIYTVSAELSYKFNSKITEALDNGVPITFLIEIDFSQKRKLLWDKKVVRSIHHVTLSFHPLSKQYLLTNLVTQDQLNFTSLQDALNTLGKINAFPIIESKFIEPATPLTATLQSRLDIEALPATLQILAYLSSDWNLKSEPFSWSIPE